MNYMCTALKSAKMNEKLNKLSIAEIIEILHKIYHQIEVIDELNAILKEEQHELIKHLHERIK